MITFLIQGYNDPHLGANYSGRTEQKQEKKKKIKTHVHMLHQIKLYLRNWVNKASFYSKVFRSLNSPAASLILENSIQNACTSMKRSWTAENKRNTKYSVNKYIFQHPGIPQMSFVVFSQIEQRTTSNHSPIKCRRTFLIKKYRRTSMHGTNLKARVGHIVHTLCT